MFEHPSEIIGKRLDPFPVIAERGQLKFFAQVLGETNPVYFNLEAAKAAGYPDLLIPPTFYFSLELQRTDSHELINKLGFDRRQFLHGEEHFMYHALAFAGEELTLTTEYTDYYVKKDGALKFVNRRTFVTRGDELVAEMDNVLAVRELELT